MSVARFLQIVMIFSLVLPTITTTYTRSTEPNLGVNIMPRQLKADYFNSFTSGKLVKHDCSVTCPGKPQPLDV